MVYRVLALAALASAAGTALPAGAQECTAPCFAYSVSAEVQGDWIFAADPSENKRSDFGPTLEWEFQAAPADHLKLIAGITTEPVLDLDPGTSRTFGEIGSYVGALYAEAEFEPLTVRAGKFDPVFGLATGALDGFYATDIVGAYDNEERLGVEAAIGFDAFGLSHAITGSAFTTDRTILSESLFVNRGRAELSDGGAGNSKGVSSFALVLDSCKGAASADCYEEGQFGYRLGARFQEKGAPAEEQIAEDIAPGDELALLGAATARADIGDETLRLLAEGAFVKNLEGGEDDALIGTISASLEAGAVTYMAAYSRQQNLIAAEPDTYAHLVDLTAVYDFGEDASFAGERWSLAAAYGFSRDAEAETAHTVGMKLTIAFENAVQLGGGGEGK